MSDMMSDEQFVQNSESEYEEEEVSTEDTESVESPVEEEEDIDEIIYNDLLHLAILVKNIPKDKVPERMEAMKGIAKGEIEIIENIEKPITTKDCNETQLFALIMTLTVILMGITIGGLIETKMDLSKFM
jgi:hypothetical protein